MPPPDTRGELYVQYLQIYCNFFVKDNLYSLLDGRSYKDILLFLDVLETLFDDDYSIKELEESIYELSENIELYTNEIKENISTQRIYCSEFSNKSITLPMVSSVFQTMEYRQVLFDFFVAYNFASKIYNSDMLDAPLIEFNNYLSHILRYVLDDEKKENLSRANGHLYRSVLDIYKGYIVSNDRIIIDNDELKNDLVELRIKEMNLIGKNEVAQDKLSTIYLYIDFIEKVDSYL